MPSETIHGLFGGISQQAPSIRLPDQLEDQTNVRNTVVRGLTKRPGTKFVSAITPPTTQSTSTAVEPMSHAINRDPTERYMVLFFDDATEPIVVLDESGAKQTVNYTLSSDKTYVHHQAVGDIKAATLDDTTVIVNTTETCALESTTTDAQDPIALVWVKPGYGSASSGHITIDGTSATWSVTGSPTTNSLAQTIASAVNGLSGVSASVLHASESSVLKIEKTDGSDFTITSGDSWGNQTAFVFKDSVEKVSDLPPEAPDGFITKVRGESDIYFKFTDESSSWVETMAPGIKTTIDAETMPRQMVRTSAGVFTVSEISYDLRTVGDDTVTPIPSFIDNSINDVTFYKDRLVFASNQSIICSRSGDYFNFWPQSAAETLDDDPIDVAAAHNTVSIIKGMLPFEDSLLLFASDQQFSLHSGDRIFSPNNVQLDQTTRVLFNSNATPVLVGSNAYFVGDQSNESIVWEYYVDPSTITREAAAVTSHVPSLVPDNIQLMAASTAYDMLFLYSPDEATTLYVYQFYWRGDEKVMSAWTKWDIGGPLQGMEILGDKLFLSMWYDSNGSVYSDLHTESIDLSPTTATEHMWVQINGDSYIDGDDVVSFNWDPGTNELTVDLGFDAGDATWYAVEKNSTASTNIVYLTSTSASGDEIVFEGLWNPTGFIFVKQFISTVTLSPWYPRDRQGRGVSAAVVKAKGLTVGVNDSGDYTATITPSERNPQIITVNRNNIESVYNNTTARTVTIDSAALRHSIMCDPQTSTITISDDSPTNLAIDSITWDGLISNRRRTV